MAGPGFDPSLTEGQLIFPYGVQCKTPWGQVRNGEISSLTGVIGDREIAYTSLFARLVLKGYVPVKAADAEGGRACDRRQPLRRQRSCVPGRACPRRSVAVDCARSDRGRASAGSNRAPHPRRPAVGGGDRASTRPPIRTPRRRLVSVTPAPSWLNHRRQGVAIDGLAPASIFRISGGRAVTLKTHEGVFRVRALSPTAPLGAFSLPAARASIRAASLRIAQDQSFDNWLMHKEQGALSRTTCRRDWLPSIGTLELTSELPFLALA